MRLRAETAQWSELEWGGWMRGLGKRRARPAEVELGRARIVGNVLTRKEIFAAWDGEREIPRGA